MKSDLIIKALKNNSADKIRAIVYGPDTYKNLEAEAMRLFIESRMENVKSEIMKELKKAVSK